MKSTERLKIFLTLFVVFFLYSTSLHANSLANIEENLIHAETYYWLGIAEQGNMAAFEKGLSYLESATKTAGQGALNEESQEDVERKISALRSDVEFQADVAHDTFYGVFPLVRLLGSSIFIDSVATRTFELVDDSDVVAVSSAAKILLTQFTKIDQIDVIFNSTPSNIHLENEALYIFNSNPKFFVHNRKEVVSFLTPDLFDKES